MNGRNNAARILVALGFSKVFLCGSMQTSSSEHREENGGRSSGGNDRRGHSRRRQGAAIGVGVGAGAGGGSEIITKGDQVKVPSEPP
jgi:hypothetical protein